MVAASSAADLMVPEEEATVMAAEAAVAMTVGSAKAVGEVKAGRLATEADLSAAMAEAKTEVD